MATEKELTKQYVPLSKIPKHSLEWVMKVLVIRRGSIIPYKNPRNEGIFRTIILVDEEGTKLQGTLFNQYVETWKDVLKPNKSYYIINGRLDRINPNFSSVHKEVELAFTDNTIIKECEHDVPTNKFSRGFITLEHAESLSNGSIFDTVCMLVTANPLIQKGQSKRREIIVTSERSVTTMPFPLKYAISTASRNMVTYLLYSALFKSCLEHTTLTLWGDFAENDGAFLEKLKDDKPILGLCDVRVSMYKGLFGMSTIPVSSVLINPTFEKAIELRNWQEILKAAKKDIVAIPSKVMKKAEELKLANIMDGLIPETQETFCKFKAKITAILNKDEPWYAACKKCYKKVLVTEDPASCTNCNIENVDYELRYCLRVEVCDGERRVRVILFDAAKYLVGCSVTEYIDSTSVKKEECKYYCKMVLSQDKEFSFLVRVDRNNANPRRTFIAEEIHEVEAEAPMPVEAGEKPMRMHKKRGKISKEAQRPIANKKIKAEKA